MKKHGKPGELVLYAEYGYVTYVTYKDSDGRGVEFASTQDKQKALEHLRSLRESDPDRKYWLVERKTQIEEKTIAVTRSTKYEPVPEAPKTDQTVPPDGGANPAGVQSVSSPAVVLQPGVLPPDSGACAYPLADGTDAHGIPRHAPTHGT